MRVDTRLPGTPEPGRFWQSPDGLQIAGDIYGEPSHQAVILLHGGGQNRFAWRRSAEMLAEEGYCAISFDARGHGDSDWAADADYTQRALARDLEGICAMLTTPPILVGASMGGMTSLVAAAGCGVTAKAILLVDVAPQTEETGYLRIRDFMLNSKAGFADADEAATAVNRFRGAAGEVKATAGLMRSLRRRPSGRLRWHWDPRLLDSRHQEMPHRAEFLAECVRRLQIPILLLRGSKSDFVSEQNAAHFLTLSSYARYRELEGLGHMIPGDRNDQFAIAMLDFVGEVARAGSSA